MSCRVVNVSVPRACVLSVSRPSIGLLHLAINQSLKPSEALRLRFFLQAEDDVRDLAYSRGLGVVYKRQQLIGGV